MDQQPGKLSFATDWQYSAAPESTDHIRIAEQYGLFIGGEFVAILANLRTLIEVSLKELEDLADEVGAPWTSGRLPRWRLRIS